MEDGESPPPGENGRPSRVGRLWASTRDYFARLFRRKPPEPGRFETDSRSSIRGLVYTAPWIWPSREYTVYLPRGHSRWRRVPLVVLIHGCRQTADEIAHATRITGLADEMGCIVLLPHQHPRANAWGCWNWFDRATAAGRGETAIVLAQVRAARRKYRIHPRRVYVAGLSSGAALAAVLGVRKPAAIAGVIAHCGIACGAASAPLAALGVLKHGADTDVVEIARHARANSNPDSLPVPLLVIQGGADDVVDPVNAVQLVRQYLTLNGHPAADTGDRNALPLPDRSVVAPVDSRTVTTSEWSVAGRLVARHVLIDELAHAWSGGDDAYPYNDPHAPDATALLGAFVRESMQ
jgi:poly(hydroxyalkanoate) depolymerase family esterase